MKSTFKYALLILLLSSAYMAGRWTACKESVYMINESDIIIDESIKLDWKIERGLYGEAIPDAKTAARMAMSLLLSNTGNDVFKEKPYRVRLIGDSIWAIKTTVRTEPDQVFQGGTGFVVLNKKDGKVLYAEHGK